MTPSGAFEEHFRRLAPRLRTLTEAEPWPHFFDARLSEWEILLRVVGDLMPAGRWLDIGSGNSASTALLGADGNWAMGMDLPARSWTTHSYGRELHARLWNGLGRAVPFVWGSAARLPFRAASFDGVFSSYALQYVPDLDEGFRELARVLKPAGAAVLVLPTTFERLYAISSMWQAIALEVVRRARGRHVVPSGAPDTPANGDAPATGGRGAWAQLRRRFPGFPLPTADSAYRTFRQELAAYGLRAWRRRAAGAGLIVERVATSSVTLRGLTQWFVSPWRAHRALRRAQARIQSGPLRPFVARLGENYVLVLRKRGTR